MNPQIVKSEVPPMIGHDAVVRLQPVFALLRQSQVLANRRQVDLWQYSVEADLLYSKGANQDDMNRLVLSGLVQHGSEITNGAGLQRTFVPGGATLSLNSCFILSAQGVALMKQNGIDCPVVDGQVSLKPTWDTRTRELRVAGQLIKRFKWQAPNQERLIAAFELQGWPSQITDPLPRDEMVDAKRRLHDTIKCLNRRHNQPIMRFHGDGTGVGVNWKISPGCS